VRVLIFYFLIRLEEFLRRRARLQRVEEEVRRRIVLGFFDMLYYSRRFKQHMANKQSARMLNIPQLGVPEIFVNEDDDQQERLKQERQQQERQRQQRQSQFGFVVGSSGYGSTAFLSADDAQTTHHRSWSGASSADVAVPAAEFIPSYGSAHPLAAARVGESAVISPTAGTHTHSFSFELQQQDPTSLSVVIPTGDVGPSGGSSGGAGGSSAGGPASAQSGRRGSSVSPAQALELLDDSVWMASIRRNATTRRSQGDWGGHGHYGK
jgi:hypothetical protein